MEGIDVVLKRDGAAKGDQLTICFAVPRCCEGVGVYGGSEQRWPLVTAARLQPMNYLVLRNSCITTALGDRLIGGRRRIKN